MSDERPPSEESLRELAERLQAGESGPNVIARLTELHPADQAALVEELRPAEGVEVMRALTPEAAAEVLEYMEDEESAALAGQMRPAELAAILDEMALDEAADLLGDLTLAQTEDLLPRLEEENAVRSLLAFPDDTAGGLMVPIAFHLNERMSASEVIEVLRRSEPDPELIYYLFVEDDLGRLAGVISLRRLVIAAPDTPVGMLMDREIYAVHALTDQEECALLLQRYGLLALPVLDDDGRLLGVITVDDLLEVVADDRDITGGR